MHAAPVSPAQDLNLGIFDGQVDHAQINTALAVADKYILLGEQTRLPHFPDDCRLPRLHAGDPLVLSFWKVLKKVPDTLRAALIDGQISFTLIRDRSLLHFCDCRAHQAIHLGRRRRTVYLPEAILKEAEARGYDYWAIAEGVIFAGWILLDYLLLTELFKSCRELARRSPGFRLSRPLIHHLIDQHNRHRREHVEEGRSEVHEFIEAYKGALLGCSGAELAGQEPFALAHRVFAPALEQQWARDKMERVAEIFNFPKMFLFDRDIIHQVARDLALSQGQELAPQCFADALHDYRDQLRFDPRPLLTAFGRGVVPKPRAVFLQEVVRLGAPGLRDFFAAYQQAEPEVVALMHPLWIYLCSLSSDPAGLFTRVGRCRALAVAGREEAKLGKSSSLGLATVDVADTAQRFSLGRGMERALAGILVRLDRAAGYEGLLEQVAAMGEAACEELEDLVARQRLAAEDEWAPFKVKKQGIVMRASAVLEQLRASGAAALSGVDLHRDEVVLQLLGDRRLHQHSSDPSGALLHLRSYQRCLEEFGPEDPDALFALVNLLVRLDRSPHGEYLAKRLEGLGAAAVPALYSVLDQLSERDEQRRPILQQARLILARLLLRRATEARRQAAS